MRLFRRHESKLGKPKVKVIAMMVNAFAIRELGANMAASSEMVAE